MSPWTSTTQLFANDRGKYDAGPDAKRGPGSSICCIWARVLAAGIVTLALSLSPAHPQAIEEKAAICAACHGVNGAPVDKSIPTIWGQQAGYLYIELRDYKRGDRKNEQMSAIVESLEKADFLALAEYFAEKPWPNLQQPRATPETASTAEQVASSAQCPQCHLSGYLGDSTNPRVAGQSYEYLLATMNAFRSGERTNNAWMSALLRTYKEAEIEALARYLAGL